MLFWDFILFLASWDRLSLCSPGYPGIQHVDQASLQLTKNPPASVFRVLWLKTCVTMPGGFYFFETGSCYVPCFSLPGAGIIDMLPFPAWNFLENSLNHYHLHMHTCRRIHVHTDTHTSSYQKTLCFMCVSVCVRLLLL